MSSFVAFQINFDIFIILASCHLANEKYWYNGNLAVTETGKTCQQWSSNSQDKESPAKDPFNYPEKSLAGAGNKCRNPDGKAKPWCYTTDPSTPWEYCDLPKCPGEQSCT